MFNNITRYHNWEHILCENTHSARMESTTWSTACNRQGSSLSDRSRCHGRRQSKSEATTQTSRSASIHQIALSH